MDSHILFIRHAESYGNISGMIGYTHENDRLTPYGIKQSQHLGRKLRRIILGSKIPVLFYVSESNRALQTAIHSGIITYGTEFIVDSRLNEIAMGKLMNIPVVKRREIFDRVLSGQDEKFPFGEGKKQVMRRGSHFANTRSKQALHIVFTHGFVIESVTGRRKPRNASITPYLP